MSTIRSVVVNVTVDDRSRFRINTTAIRPIILSIIGIINGVPINLAILQSAVIHVNAATIQIVCV